MATIRRTRHGRKFTQQQIHAGNLACTFVKLVDDACLNLSVRDSDDKGEGEVVSLSYSLVLNLNELEQVEKFIADMRAQYLNTLK